MRCGLIRTLGRKFGREEWNIGIVHQPIDDVVRSGITTPIHWWPERGPWKMFADPACIEDEDGSLLLFAEHLDYRVGRGEIWAARVHHQIGSQRPVLHPWMCARSHVSYPRPVQGQNGRLYFMVESAEAGALHLWAKDGKDVAHVDVIIDQPVLDPTPWHDGTTWWLFCTPRYSGPNAFLLLFHADRLEGPWTPHVANPVKRDIASSRPAGPLIEVDGDLIRPAQNCSQTYGGGITLNRITRLDKECFKEEAVRQVQPDPAYPDGIHTICSAGDATVIDGKRWSFQPVDVPRKIAVALAGHFRQRLLAPALPLRIALPAGSPVQREPYSVVRRTEHDPRGNSSRAPEQRPHAKVQAAPKWME